MKHALATAALAFGVASCAAPATAQLNGINLSGGEFKRAENGALLPRPADLQAYHDVGFRLFRVPFRSVQVDRADARAKLRAVADKCDALRVPCIFDRHEYKWPAVEEQVAFWTRFAKAMPASAQIDLMNEPKGFDDPVLTNNYEQWVRDVRLIVTGLRKAGIKNRIWVEWPGYSGISRFPVAALKGGIPDPLNRTGVQAHRYFDKGGSGTSGYCVKGKGSGFARFAAQAAALGMPAMIGEAAFGKSKGCVATAAATMAELKAGIPNLYGVTWWGGGRAWKKGYLFHTPADSSNYTARLALKNE